MRSTPVSCSIWACSYSSRSCAVAWMNFSRFFNLSSCDFFSSLTCSLFAISMAIFALTVLVTARVFTSAIAVSAETILLRTSSLTSCHFSRSSDSFTISAEVPAIWSLYALISTGSGPPEEGINTPSGETLTSARLASSAARLDTAVR